MLRITRLAAMTLMAIILAVPAVAQASPVVHGQTDIGRTRSINQDVFAIFEQAKVYVVADGMGGPPAGEVASALAVDEVRIWATHPALRVFQRHFPALARDWLVMSYHAANLRILKTAAENPAQRGMGTTLVALMLAPKGAFLFNVGDSRAYRIRNNHLVQITRDHSLLQNYIDKGILKTPEEIEHFPYKHIMTQALGTQPIVEPDVYFDTPHPGDIYLLCSDGLTDEVPDDQILAIILAAPSIEEAVTQLIDTANKRGGRDNIAVILVAL